MGENAGSAGEPGVVVVADVGEGLNAGADAENFGLACVVRCGEVSELVEFVDVDVVVVVLVVDGSGMVVGAGADRCGVVVGRRLRLKRLRR